MNVTVEVSFNGDDWTTQGHLYEIHNEVNITKVFPSKGPASGGTIVTVHGEGFLKRTALAGYFGCRFGTITTPATYISSQALKCISPMAPAGFRNLEITTNSIYSHTGQQFEGHAVAKLNN